EQGLADHDLVDRLLEELRKARHVHALLARVEVDRALDLRRDQLLDARVRQPDGLADAGDADAREADAYLGRGRLQVVCENPWLHVVEPGYVLRPSRLARVPRPAHAARHRARVRAHDREDGRARGA